MKELDPFILLAVFQEMLGPLLWLILAVVVVGTLAFLLLLVRERKIYSRRLMWSQLAGLFGGVMSLVIMAKVSASGYSDAAGPADWILLVLVFAVGAVGTTVLTYTIVGWVRTAMKVGGAQITSA
ncbi:MAG TPA: DUF5368 domain-containing protein [Burkholderiaceae bacterium]|nr:DUF5368 domain-containing protein [Burkholderiaceae bacterium]